MFVDFALDMWKVKQTDVHRLLAFEGNENCQASEAAVYPS